MLIFYLFNFFIYYYFFPKEGLWDYSILVLLFLIRLRDKDKVYEGPLFGVICHELIFSGLTVKMGTFRLNK